MVESFKYFNLILIISFLKNLHILASYFSAYYLMFSFAIAPNLHYNRANEKLRNVSFPFSIPK